MQTLQLPLHLNLRDDAIFDNYFIGDNAQLVDVLKNFISVAQEQFIYCYGEPGSGRTHLLQACCHEADKKNKSIFYLSLANYAEFSPTIFDALESQEYVCIDDVDAIVGNMQWEEALFHFYNRAQEKKVSLLVSAQVPPKQLSCVLKDLQSRLSWGLTLGIKNLNDAEKMEALQMRAHLRGFYLSNEVASYLIHHYSRNMRDLFFILEKLDKASLAAKRKLTIPFIKAIKVTI
ncbi:MAG: DnaA regulatory inactivator Hda [Gammaproteobacteria bacterium CG_4_10_14_0_8_um_filter_38_16]|nr:MAG: DnaA regulatory inactivator Hda [Gammaproteobacteria bacterium CG_4_10_14_0_8_um_filter_38_16]PJA03664.1 MAG: DnaA regulatory inactivator Hda [Gammaproteobacteria bacterium CG_4_10_14_0_2_um_filter_38_22]PJB11330.1 MAG: DnaA regulatory inactivator Hda [Gammaproteobacteria bacterium CG_4_9_14_3_um_filter_38_9]